MKSLITVLALIVFLHANTFAQKQKITWKDDTIKVDGKPYAIMVKKNAGVLQYDFSVRSFGGTELIYFKSTLVYSSTSATGKQVVYDANFIGSGAKADITQISGLGMAKLVVENNLIKEDQIDVEAEKRFIQLQGGYYPTNNNFNNKNNNGSTVVINNNVNVGNTEGSSENNTNNSNTTKSKSPVTITGNQIIRDSVQIGKFRQDTTSSNYSQKLYLLTIYSVDGEKVAEASVPVVKPEEWKITILADKKEFNIMYDAPGEKEKLFKWLADKGYLKE